ncbi:MAG: hypothetical protein QM706_14225 [Nitrospira sp.]
MRGGLLRTHVPRYVLALFMLAMAMPSESVGQEAVLDLFPLRPFSFDVSFNDRSFAPTRRVFALQAGITALRYGPLELRGIYQYYSHYTPAFGTDQHSLYVNPRWNNFIDLVDVLEGKPISRFLRHALFGPLENRAVPYLGAMLGGNLSGADFSPGYLYGGQIGVRFPVAQGFSVDMGLQYTRFQVDFEGAFGASRQWLYTIGVRF